jgi:oxygen-independent coproporphyrinogen-3 oxidase
VPFCARRCGYCNFTLVAGRDDLVESYLRAIETELSWLDRPRPVETLFFGGGTPTHLARGPLSRLLRAATDWFPLQGGGEFSVEANPGDLDIGHVKLLAGHGVTRISLGAQSFDAQKLRTLERDHTPGDIARSVELAREARMAVSLDMIFASPGETLDGWTVDLNEALRLEPDHISIYGLSYEQGTTFWSRLHKSELVEVKEEPQRQMYLAAVDRLTAAGYEHYEVSNFARPGCRCRHNEVYWAGEGYYAAGPGAARYVDGRREINHRSTTTYIKRVLSGRSPVAESESLAAEDRAREALVFGLRRMEGVDREQFERQMGFELDALVGDPLRRFVELGVLEDDGSCVRLSREGLPVSDSIWPAFLRV